MRHKTSFFLCAIAWLHGGTEQMKFVAALVEPRRCSSTTRRNKVGGSSSHISLTSPIGWMVQKNGGARRKRHRREEEEASSLSFVLLATKGTGGLDNTDQQQTTASSASTGSSGGGGGDKFANLVESHPLDDAEPTPHEKYPNLPPMPTVKILRTRVSKVNPYNIPIDPEEEWEWYYNLLLTYNSRKQQQQGVDDGNGDNDDDDDHPVVVVRSVKDSLLRNWMANQRKSFMKTLGVLDIGEKANWGTEYLTQERKNRLDDANFYWGHLQVDDDMNDIIYSADFQRRVRLKYKDWIWNPIYDRLVTFHTRHNHTNVPLGREDGLGVWTAEQRKLRWDMPSRRRMRLDELDFDWEWTDDDDAATTTAASFGTDTQGGMMGLSTAELSERRRKKKKEEGGGGGVVKKTIPWSTRMTQLKSYRKKYGDCNVPLDYEEEEEHGIQFGLGQWVKRMRRRKRKLSPRSVMQLEKLGFEFDDE